MKQEPIVHSPNAYDPILHMLMSDEEKKKMYHRQVNDLEKPSSVIEVIREVYHRSFSDDLIESLSDTIIVDGLKKAPDKNSEIRFWVNKLDIKRVESVYDQPATNFYVDILVDTRVKVQETIPGSVLPPRRFNLETELRLRYRFDLRPCELNCWYIGVITDEKRSIYSIYPNSIHLNRYLLPVIQTSEEYERLARDIIKEYLPEYLDSDKPISSLEWLERMGLRVYSGVFPERSVTGEYFFGFGLADVYDLESGEIIKDTIRDFLHFSVPDKGPLTDYESWMPDFMQGMAKGIERSRGLIQKAISHVSGDMVITPNTSAALIGGYGTTAVSNTTNNSNVTYNFNQTNNSPKALSRFDIYRQSKNLLSGVKGR